MSLPSQQILHLHSRCFCDRPDWNVSNYNEYGSPQDVQKLLTVGTLMPAREMSIDLDFRLGF